MKKTIALLLAVIMLLSAVPAFATDVRTSGLYTYEIKGNGTITITDFNWEKNDGDIFIPNMIDGYTVTAIGDEAFSIEKQPYTGCSVTLPEGIKSIGDRAFFNANINAINLPSSLQHIGTASFYGCPSCQFKPTPNHPFFAVIDEGLYSKSKKELIAYSWENSEKEEATIGYEINISIPEGIQHIGAYAFADMQSSSMADVNVTLPSTLTSIGDYAFAGVEWISDFNGNLTSLKTIGEGAFKECKVHRSKLIMPAVETIFDYAFENASMYTDVFANSAYSIRFVGAPINHIGNNAFDLIQTGEDSYSYNVFKIDIGKCSDIGANNKGLGMIMTDESDFSPELTTIPVGLNPQVNSLPSTITAIEGGAFTKEVVDFRLPTSLNDIDVNAFPKGSTFIVDSGSYAELWCSENGFGYTVEGQEDDLSWLTDGLEVVEDTNPYAEHLIVMLDAFDYMGLIADNVDISSIETFCSSCASVPDIDRALDDVEVEAFFAEHADALMNVEACMEFLEMAMGGSF